MPYTLAPALGCPSPSQHADRQLFAQGCPVAEAHSGLHLGHRVLVEHHLCFLAVLSPFHFQASKVDDFMSRDKLTEGPGRHAFYT